MSDPNGHDVICTCHHRAGEHETTFDQRIRLYVRGKCNHVGHNPSTHDDVPCACRTFTVPPVRQKDLHHSQGVKVSDVLTAAERVSHGFDSDWRVPRLWNEEEDGPGVISTEYDIEKAIEMSVAMTRYLLSLPEQTVVYVHVQPENRRYVVTIEVAGLVLRHHHKRLSVALESLLAELSNRVHKRIEEARALLCSCKRTDDGRGTYPNGECVVHGKSHGGGMSGHDKD